MRAGIFGLTDEELARIVMIAKEDICPVGVVIFRDDDGAAKLYVLMSGVVA
jgi:hypothetical protein